MTAVITKPSALRRTLDPILPEYGSGETFIDRFDEDGEGPGRWLSLAWLGLSFTLYYGRTPKKGTWQGVSAARALTE